MPDRFQHLDFPRELDANPRRSRRGFGGPPPSDPQAHARRLTRELDAHRPAPSDEIAGFDPRRLLKLDIEQLDPSGLEAIPGLSVVAQEGKNVTVLFATDAALDEFRRRLQLLANGRSATRKDILFAVRGFEYVSAEDRTGPALRAEGRPTTPRCWVDVELWPLELSTERVAIQQVFRAWCQGNGTRVLDAVANHAIILLRVDVATETLDDLLRMRDVRLVDLPPRYQLESRLLRLDIGAISPVPGPPVNAPGIVVLDTGIVTNHPLLGPAVGDAQSFVEGDSSSVDATGHGSAVAGLCLYGDVEACASAGSFVPELRLFSGRIVAGDGTSPTELIENSVAKAVAYFKEAYGSRVFNLSFGDERKPYAGGHVDRFAATLDTLAREYGVLFVVSAGNFAGTDAGPASWRDEYPNYLLTDQARIIDPAPALNALTVGSLAHYEGSHMAVRFPSDPAYQPIARRDEPSPFSRTGPGPRGAIKPELVDYGGNLYLDTRAGLSWNTAGRELGELTTNHGFATGNLLTADVGTSFATAKVSNLAARILGTYPSASPSMLRALLAAHASVPDAVRNRLGGDQAKILRFVGYGRPDQEATLFSSENRVTLIAEDALPPDQHHFYELPLPEDLFSGPARRERRLTVAIAHAPEVRRTRLDYKNSALSFRIVRARNLAAVTSAYRRLSRDEVEPSIPEEGFMPSPSLRAPATLQCATRIIRQVDSRLREKPYFLVITNRPASWVPASSPEPYAVVVVIEDRSSQQVQLYTQISAQLRARSQVRAQVRA